MSRKIIFLLLFASTPLHSLELTRVILACDANPMYADFWPIVARAWSQRIGLKPTLAFIAPKHISIDETVGEVFRFEPIPGIPIALQTQVIRLLIPALFPEDGCVISDMDLLPISKEYIVGSARPYPHDRFIVYRDRAHMEAHQYPMVYVAALGKTYGEIFEVSTKQDIIEKIKSWATHKLGWYTDQLAMRAYVDAWHQKTGKRVLLGHGVERRIDRSQWGYSLEHLRAGYYIDAHLVRPYGAYRAQIDQLCHDLGLQK